MGVEGMADNLKVLRSNTAWVHGFHNHKLNPEARDLRRYLSPNRRESIGHKMADAISRLG